MTSRGTYGYRRVHAELTIAMGVTVLSLTLTPHRYRDLSPSIRHSQTLSGERKHGPGRAVVVGERDAAFIRDIHASVVAGG